MIVPAGFISLLDAVNSVATDLDPEAMGAAKPRAVGALDQLERFRAARAASVSVTDRVKRHPISRLPPPITPLFSRQDAAEPVNSAYGRLSQSERAKVDRFTLAAQSMQEAGSISREFTAATVTWTELLNRKSVACDQARKLVWQALADGVLQAQLRDDYGYPYVVPPEPWLGKSAASAILSGRLECFLPSISMTARGRIEIGRAAFRAWWAQSMPAKQPTDAMPQKASGADGTLQRTREEKEADAKIWMKRHVTAPGWKRDAAIRDCAEQTGCGHLAARVAWTALPASLKGTRGAPKAKAGG